MNNFIINTTPNLKINVQDGTAYLLALEGVNDLGESLSLIAQADYNKSGLMQLYTEGLKRWKNTDTLSKCYIVGVKDGKFCYRRPDQMNFSENARKFADVTLAETKTVAEMNADSRDRGNYTLDTIKRIDERFNTNFIGLIQAE